MADITWNGVMLKVGDVRIRKLYGATIRVDVARSMVGQFLQRLEHHADVFIIGRRALPASNVKRFVLRSDTFPREWDGRHANPCMHEKHNGFFDWGVAGTNTAVAKAITIFKAEIAENYQAIQRMIDEYHGRASGPTDSR